MRPLASLLPPILFVTMACCCEPDPPKPDGGPPPGDFDCELGLRGEQLDSFVPLTESNEAELMLGFQGLAGFVMRVAMSPEAPTTVEALISVRITGQPPNGSQALEIATSVLPDGRRLTRDLLVPANRGPLTDYAGQTAEVSVRVADSLLHPTALCVATGQVLLVDNDQCIHTGQEPLCPDAGPQDAGTDAGAPDAGSDDAGGDDAGPVDAGSADAGSLDAGQEGAG